MSGVKELGDLFARHLISDGTQHATQNADGSWFEGAGPLTRSLLSQHFHRQICIGHYPSTLAGTSKSIIFRIELLDKMIEYPATSTLDSDGKWVAEPRGGMATMIPSRAWFTPVGMEQLVLIAQFRRQAHNLVRHCRRLLGPQVRTCAAYVHGTVQVIAMLGVQTPLDAIENGAHIVLQGAGFGQDVADGGSWYHTNTSPLAGFPALQVTVPSIDAEGPVPLPMGLDARHPQDVSFFLNLRSSLDVMAPEDPFWALATSNPFETPAESAARGTT